MDPLTLALIGGLSGINALIGSQETPRDKAMALALQKIREQLPWLQSLPYSKHEIEGKVTGMQETARGAANVAAGQVGASLAESLSTAGVPKGQPTGSIYTSEMAPVIAQGERDAIEIEQWGTDLFANMDAETKQRAISALGLLVDTSSKQQDMTGWQKGIATFLQSFNLLSTGFGNVAKGFKDFNYKPVGDPN